MQHLFRFVICLPERIIDYYTVQTAEKTLKFLHSGTNETFQIFGQ